MVRARDPGYPTGKVCRRTRNPPPRVFAVGGVVCCPPVNVVEVLGLFGAGALAGVVGTVVSLASIISYPVLLAFGLPPVTANVTNTVALTFNGVGAAFGSRPELADRGRGSCDSAR